VIYLIIVYFLFAEFKMYRLGFLRGNDPKSRSVKTKTHPVNSIISAYNLVQYNSWTTRIAKIGDGMAQKLSESQKVSKTVFQNRALASNKAGSNLPFVMVVSIAIL